MDRYAESAARNAGLREGRPSLADLTGCPETLATKFKGLWACAWFGALHSRRELAPTPSAADFAGPLAREIVRQKTPLPLMAMAALIPSSIRDAGPFHSRKRPFMATRRRFVRRGFASHAVFNRIRSCFRNLVISSLSTAFPYAKAPCAKNSPPFNRG